jgi:hypothetical protein
MTPKEQSDFEQATAELMDLYAPSWRRLFDNLIEQKFTEQQSLRLVEVYILSQCPHGVNGVE